MTFKFLDLPSLKDLAGIGYQMLSVSDLRSFQNFSVRSGFGVLSSFFQIPIFVHFDLEEFKHFFNIGKLIL